MNVAQRLADLGFWLFPVAANSKTPAVKDWQRHATRDAAQLPAGNLGIFTGKFGDGEALLVVDVDVKNGKDGNDAILKLELEGCELPETFTQNTPSGGRHLVYRCRAPVKQGANVLGDGLDVRSRGGYVVAAGSTLDGVPYSADFHPIVEAPGWLVKRCGIAREPAARENKPAVEVDANRATNRAIKFLSGEAPAGLAGGRNDAGYRTACRVKDLGVDEDACFALMAEHWHCDPPLGDEELRHVCRSAYRYGEAPQGAAAPEADFTPAPEAAEKMHPFDELNKEYAFVLAGGGAHILWETTDANGRFELQHLAMAAFHAKFAAHKIAVGKKSAAVTAEWMEWTDRRSFDGLVFRPGLTAPARFYNLWRGFTVVPAATGKHSAVEAWLEHALKNVCHGNEYLFRWLIGYFAHMIQRPWEKPLTALVFRGGKGVGKNALVERVGHLLGGHFLISSNRRYLVGNFNGHLENLLMLGLDEAFWSGDKAAEGQLKDLITGSEHIIEHKGKEPYKVENRTRVVIIGNEDWLVPATSDERRYAVFDVGTGRKQDRAFFQGMREGMERGGYAHLLRYLLDFDLAGIDLNAAPSTEALMEQKQHSLHPLHRWWMDCLEEGCIQGFEMEGWPEQIECKRFYSAVKRYFKDNNIRTWSPDERTGGKLLRNCLPSIVKRRHSRGPDGVQPYYYLLPDLDAAREEWNKFIGHDVAWPE